MKIVSDSRTQISQPQSAITESIEEVKRVIQDCKASAKFSSAVPLNLANSVLRIAQVKAISV